jgi:hypothetical protein
VAFTARAIDWFARHGVTVERIMSDNGSAYKSFAFRDLLAGRGIKHKRTRPYTPRTNGKAERFIQTSLREWAYVRAFATSAERAAAMRPWIDTYNASRPHAALGRRRRSSGSPRSTPLKRLPDGDVLLAALALGPIRAFGHTAPNVEHPGRARTSECFPWSTRRQHPVLRPSRCRTGHGGG